MELWRWRTGGSTNVSMAVEYAKRTWQVGITMQNGRSRTISSDGVQKSKGMERRPFN
jgi:hypothetical protein